ncbi:MAG: tetratricopeptide repeat protein, partial [Chthoniobacterales bacterium]
MTARRSAAGVLLAMVALAPLASAQRTGEVRRAQPVEEPAVLRALPLESATPLPRRAASPAPTQTPAPRPPVQVATPRPAVPRPTAASAESPEPDTAGEAEPREQSGDTESQERRQLDYANALFGRKLYDLAVPEYEKFLGQFSGAAGRASAYFYLGQCYRALNRTPAARSAFQSVLDDFGGSEFAGPAAYGVGEILFNQREYAGAVTFFHRSAAKTKEAELALSARYFEARCLENL